MTENQQVRKVGNSPVWPVWVGAGKIFSEEILFALGASRNKVGRLPGRGLQCRCKGSARWRN